MVNQRLVLWGGIVALVLLINMDPTTAIVGGSNASEGQFPYMAQILKLNSSTKMEKCGAVIVSRNMVLTAAHCVNVNGTQPASIESIKVLAGELEYGNLTRVCKSQLRKVTKIIIHPNYSEANLTNLLPLNDLALLVLSSPFEFTPLIQKIDLPKIEQMYGGSGVFASNTSSVSMLGWGNSDPKMEQLRWAEVEMLDPLECEKIYGDTKFKALKMLCAGGNGSGFCANSGSGGPLACKINNITHVCGIASFSNDTIGCGKQPQGFVRVAYAVTWTWIVNNINKEHERQCGYECRQGDFDCDGILDFGVKPAKVICPKPFEANVTVEKCKECEKTVCPLPGKPKVCNNSGNFTSSSSVVKSEKPVDPNENCSFGAVIALLIILILINLCALGALVSVLAWLRKKTSANVGFDTVAFQRGKSPAAADDV